VTFFTFFTIQHAVFHLSARRDSDVVAFSLHESISAQA
jgi:hypothetical protein